MFSVSVLALGRYDDVVFSLGEQNGMQLGFIVVLFLVNFVSLLGLARHGKANAHQRNNQRK